MKVKMRKDWGSSQYELDLKTASLGGGEMNRQSLVVCSGSTFCIPISSSYSRNVVV